jgi:hypothetical protein
MRYIAPDRDVLLGNFPYLLSFQKAALLIDAMPMSIVQRLNPLLIAISRLPYPSVIVKPQLLHLPMISQQISLVVVAIRRSSNER